MKGALGERLKREYHLRLGRQQTGEFIKLTEGANTMSQSNERSSLKQVNQTRIAKLQRCMKDEALNVFVVSTQDSIFYLSGAAYVPVERPFFIVVWSEGAPSLVVPQLELEHMRSVDGFKEIKSYFEFPTLKGENWYDRINAMLPDNARVGIESDLSVAKAGLLKAKEIVPTDIIPHLRMIMYLAAVSSSGEGSPRNTVRSHSAA